MKPALLVIAFLIFAWAVNGEFTARRLDNAYEIATTECVTSVEQAARGFKVSASMAGHETMYAKIRNTLIKHGAGCKSQQP